MESTEQDDKKELEDSALEIYFATNDKEQNQVNKIEMESTDQIEKQELKESASKSYTASNNMDQNQEKYIKTNKKEKNEEKYIKLESPEQDEKQELEERASKYHSAENNNEQDQEKFFKIESPEQDEKQEMEERVSESYSSTNNKEQYQEKYIKMEGHEQDEKQEVEERAPQYCFAAINKEQNQKKKKSKSYVQDQKQRNTLERTSIGSSRLSIKMETPEQDETQELDERDPEHYFATINKKQNQKKNKESTVQDQKQKSTFEKTSIFITEKDNELLSRSIREDTDKTLLRLSGQSKTLCNKLLVKRHYLQKQEKSVQNNKYSLKENDRKAFKALQTMRKCSKNNYATSQQSNEVGCNSSLPSSDFKPINQLSKKHLESLVGGLQELIFKLTLSDISLKTKVDKLVANINVLKNFPLFMDPLDDIPSTSSGRQRRDSDYSNVSSEYRQRHDSDYYQQTHENYRHRSGNEKIQEQKKKKDNVDIMSPVESFTKYINAMISDYLGDQQQENIEELKCLPSHIDDLETYSLTLVQAGLGRIVEEEIRINRKNNRQAFVIMSAERDTIEKDAIILLPVARRYAFEGDVVKAFVLNSVGADLTAKRLKKRGSLLTESNKDSSICLADDEDPFGGSDYSPDSDNDEINDLLDTSTVVVCDNCPKAFVISIVKQTELREIVGSISFMKTTLLNSKSYYKLKPHDMKVPMVYIPTELCKEHIDSANKDDIVGMLYLARILETDGNGHCIGELLQPVGKVGNLKAEIKAILLHNGLKDLQPYEQKFHDMYADPMPAITKNDLKSREDLRKKCVFTIDPLTARDLDDAVSVDAINDDEYEIGVHISDVSHYLEENSELDNLVKDRATSIYLVNEVIHMLPPSLCFRCSLLPGEDKFAFSVFWRWNIEKEQLSEPRFTRTIINSCSQFAYEHAQKVIDNPTENFDIDDFPPIFNNWSAEDIKWRVLQLHQIAKKLKIRRYDGGALSINNPKLRFQLDTTTGEPLSYEVEGRQEANFLIEEFMLLANQSVAKFIHDHFPETSILRNHSPPLQKSMHALRERLSNMGLEFNISSSKTIYESMQRLCRESTDPKAMDACLSTLLTKPMARARYFCSEGKTSEEDFWHYALSIPIYTHFTSPIRRYPDILVHRLLAAALNYCPPPQRTTDELHQLAKVCNDQKFNAKNAGDESIELFFTRFVKAKQLITLKAVVTDIFKHMLNVVTIETGHSLTITYKLQKVLVDTSNVPSFVLLAEKNSVLPPVKLQLFSTVDINVTLRNDKICGFFVSPDKQQRRVNSKESSKKSKLYHNNTNTANGLRTKSHNSFSEQEDDKKSSSKISTKNREKKSK